MPERGRRVEYRRLAETLSTWRAAFRRWRRSRPFWAGIVTLLAAGELIYVPGLSLGGLTIHQGVAGIASWLMAALMAFMAMVMWFQPHVRSIAGITTILFALASFLTSNFGGFLLGMLLGLVGGSMAVAWTPDKPDLSQPIEAPENGEPDESLVSAPDSDPSLADDLVGERRWGTGA